MMCSACNKMKMFLQRLNGSLEVDTAVSVYDVTTKAHAKIIILGNNRVRVECSSQDYHDGVPDWSWKKSRYTTITNLSMVLAHRYSIVNLVETREKLYFNKKSHHYMRSHKWDDSCAEIRLGLQIAYVLHINNQADKGEQIRRHPHKSRDMKKSWRRS